MVIMYRSMIFLISLLMTGIISHFFRLSAHSFELPLFTNTNKLKNVKNLRFLHGRLSDATAIQKVSKMLKISPPWNAPSIMWKLAWKLHHKLLPVLHLFDSCRAENTFVNLAIIWLKAIVGNRKGSKLYDCGIAFDMLPSFTRNIIRFPFCWLFPNFHHQNVALRTVFLDNAVKTEIKNSLLTCNEANETVQVIVLGAGFDVRSIKLMEYFKKSRKTNIEFHEIDLNSVTLQKEKMFKRFLTRRKKFEIPNLHSADLNNIEEVENCLNRIKSNNLYNKKIVKKTIIVSEAVLLYLEKSRVFNLLQTCIKNTGSYSQEVSFCFADRFPDVESTDALSFITNSTSNVLNTLLISTSNLEKPEFSTKNRVLELKKASSSCVELAALIEYFSRLNMNLIEWIPKPGLARHMGVACLNTKNSRKSGFYSTERENKTYVEAI